MIEIQPIQKFNDDNNLRTIINKLLKYWPLFIISLVIGITSSYVYLKFYATNLYEINSKILIRNMDQNQGSSQLNPLENLGLIKSSYHIDDEIGILTSSGIMEDVITKHDLNISFYRVDQIKDEEIYGEQVPVKVLVDETSNNLVYDEPINLTYLTPETFELKSIIKDQEYSSKHHYGELISAPYGTFTVLPTFDTDSIGGGKFDPFYFKVVNKEIQTSNFLSSLKVVPASNNGGGLLNLTLISNHKKKGEEILTQLIATYIDKSIAFENELAENTIKIIDDRIKLLSGDIEKVEDSVVEFKTRNVVTDVSSNADTYIEQANEYKSRMMEYETQINVLETIENTIQEGSTESTIGGMSSFNDIALTSLINSYNEALLKKQKLSQSASTSNPIITTIDGNLNNLRSSILQNVRSLKNGYIIARNNLLSNAGRFDARIAKVPAMEKELLNISREKSTKEGLYLYLLQKREEEILSLAAPVSSTRIINLPKAGLYPFSPRKKMVYLAGLLFGLFIPVSIIYLKEALNNKIVSSEDLTERISMPFLGEIYRTKGKESLVVNENKSNPNSELFRLLHFNIDYLKKSEKNQTLLITSTIKGEGKTYIATNLAASLALSGEKVIILAFDLREPKIMQNFKLPNSPGIADYILKEDMKLDQIIQRHPTFPNFFLIGSGVVKMQLSRLMLSHRIEELMDNLKTEFDRIIVDTAPVGLVADAFALNPYIDSTICVVRKDVTKKEYLKTLNSIYENEKLKNPMVLLNDVKQPSDGFGYGYGISEE